MIGTGTVLYKAGAGPGKFEITVQCTGTVFKVKLVPDGITDCPAN